MDARSWRVHIRSRLAEARAEILAELLGLSTETLATAVVHRNMTIAGVLLRRAGEDRLCTSTLASRNDPPMTFELREPVASAASDQLETALAAFLHSRRLLLDVFAGLSDNDVWRRGESGVDPTVPAAVEESGELDRQAAQWIRSWRSREHPVPAAGPPDILIAAFKASRKELLTALALIPAPARSELMLPGGQTLAAALSRMADSAEKVMAALAGHGAAGSSDMAWHTTWRRFHDSHHHLLGLIESLSTSNGIIDDELYCTICDLAREDRRQAAAIRQAAALTGPASTDAPRTPGRTASRRHRGSPHRRRSSRR